jgi:hypothetical protein
MSDSNSSSDFFLNAALELRLQYYPDHLILDLSETMYLQHSEGGLYVFELINYVDDPLDCISAILQAIIGLKSDSLAQLNDAITATISIGLAAISNKKIDINLDILKNICDLKLSLCICVY